MPAIPAVFRTHNIEQSQASLTTATESESVPQGGFAPSSRFIAYGAFFLFAVVYFWRYLPEGFSLYDDGYLLGLGRRVSSGESLYRDFYFFRTPLSVYWQAGLIALFGNSYTVLASKIVWALQITATVCIVSLIYRRWMNSVLLALTLCATLVYSSMLLLFPWYTYDAMFFTAIFAFLFYERRYLPAGVAAGLAFLCKQSFVALIPVTIAIWLIALVISGGSISHWRKALVWLLVGMLSVVIVMCGLLAMQGVLGDFWRNAFVLPASANPLPLQFVMIQNLPDVAAVAWPFTMLMGAILLARVTHWSIAAVTAAAFLAFTENLLNDESTLVFSMTALLYVMLLIGITRAAYTVRREHGGRVHTQRIMFLSVSLAALYVAGLNYSGWHFANIGGVVALPALISMVAGRDQAGSKDTAEQDSFARGPLRFVPRGYSLQAAIFALGTLALAIGAHHKFPYLQGERDALVVPFQSSLLAGIVGEADHVWAVDSVVGYVEQNAGATDEVFAFPDFTALNYLTGRTAWGRVQWHYRREFDFEMALETSRELRVSPPDLAIVRTHWRHQSLEDEPYEYADLDREKVILDALMEDMTAVDTIGRFLIMRPNSGANLIQPVNPAILEALRDSTLRDVAAERLDMMTTDSIAQGPSMRVLPPETADDE